VVQTDLIRVIGPLLILVTLVVGCGPAVDGYSGPRGSLAGRLTIDGKPVREGCQILFMAAQGSFVASGTVEGDGNYKALYRVPAGLPVGDYVVQLGLPRNHPSSAAPGAGDSMTAVDFDQLQRAWKASLPFPQRYFSTSTSGLKLTVQPGANAANFDLTEGDQAGKVGK
jgi:hypothetical protein